MANIRPNCPLPSTPTLAPGRIGAALSLLLLRGMVLAIPSSSNFCYGSLPLEGRAGEGGEACTRFQSPLPNPPHQGEGIGKGVHVSICACHASVKLVIP